MKLGIALVCIVSAPAAAAHELEDFHRATYALHEKQLARREVRAEEEKADYEGAAAAHYRYVETRYFDAAGGRLLSRVRRDADAPESVRIVEVNIYENGRLVRDFGSVTLPWAPLRPVRTFINLTCQDCRVCLDDYLGRRFTGAADDAPAIVPRGSVWRKPSRDSEC